MKYIKTCCILYYFSESSDFILFVLFIEPLNHEVMLPAHTHTKDQMSVLSRLKKVAELNKKDVK